MSKKAHRISVLLIATFLILLLSSSPITAGPDTDTQVEKMSSISSNYMLGGEIRVSEDADPEPQRSYTAVAYNDKQDEYLVVWSNEWLGGHKDVSARRVESDGTLLSQFTVASGAGDKYDPAVVYNSMAEEYLVVWLYTPTGGGNTNEVWGRLVSGDGLTLEPEFQIASWPNRLFADPSVAWNSNLDEYLVVWGAQDASAGWNLDVSSMLLAANGDILTGRNLTTSNQPFDPDVVYNPVTNEYFVVYTTFTFTTQQDIKGLRVKADNSVINPPGEISIVDNNVGESEPSVATNGKTNYAVVWQSRIGSDYDIYGQRLDFNGNKPWNWDSYALTSGIDESHPDIAYDGEDTYLITWQRFDSPVFSVRAQSRDFAADTYKYFDVASDAVLPVVAAGSSQFLVAYQGIYPSGGSDYRHIFGRFLFEFSETTCTPLTSLTVTGPTVGQTGSSYVFQVDNLSPLDVTFPITYTWSPTPDNQSGNSATYSWSTEGVKTITATGSNCEGGGSASDDHTITISADGSGVKLYLPLTMRLK
jgi:hypothetical protein